MLIDALMGAFVANPDLFFPAYIGPEDGVRLRMLRLARAAVPGLLALTLLYQDLADHSGGETRVIRSGKILLAIGALGMPLLLVLAGFTWLNLKAVLGIPALAILAGTLVGVSLACTEKRTLEVWGWLLIAASMGAGLFMGLYAFDGPLPTPDFLGAYNDFNRRLSRLAHGYAIVLGLISIFMARELDRADVKRWPRRLGVVFFVVGSIATVAGVSLQAVPTFPLAVLLVGPALVTSGMAICLLGHHGKGEGHRGAEA
jgi:hypothetical protein